ncbi:hypothetical protein DRE_00707 [Drechslerella stenobrocha 248]|uniref:Uncharacterized protein n=1 Tax=Drechslerella stenobrocha 248 TaxID=1043628 RepID=W7HZD1_9PEZI|nr:hypothetical protein DRE_00707 [Drechslerella stenobrocha 248]
MGSGKKKMPFLKRARTKTAIQYNAFMGLVVRVLLARVLPHQKLKKYDLTGKNAIVTGSNTGLGKAMAMHLAQMNATVYLACRNLTKAEVARSDILKSAPTATVHVLPLDTSTLEDCRRFCADWAADGGKTIDILMHNAGVGCPPTPDAIYGPDGFEHLYMTNFLSNVLLTSLLEGYLASDARIVMTSSPGAFVGGVTNDFALASPKNAMEAGFNYKKGQKVTNSILYSNGKLMQVCLARMLTHKYRAEGKDIAVHAYTPGYTASEFFDKKGVAASTLKSDIIWFFLRTGVKFAMSPEEAGKKKTGVFLATDHTQKVADKGGYLFERMKPMVSGVDLYDDDILDRLWNRWCADAGIQWDHLPVEGSPKPSGDPPTEKSEDL